MPRLGPLLLGHQGHAAQHLPTEIQQLQRFGALGGGDGLHHTGVILGHVVALGQLQIFPHGGLIGGGKHGLLSRQILGAQGLPALFPVGVKPHALEILHQQEQRGRRQLLVAQQLEIDLVPQRHAIGTVLALQRLLIDGAQLGDIVLQPVDPAIQSLGRSGI